MPTRLSIRVTHDEHAVLSAAAAKHSRKGELTSYVLDKLLADAKQLLGEERFRKIMEAGDRQSLAQRRADDEGRPVATAGCGR